MRIALRLTLVLSMMISSWSWAGENHDTAHSCDTALAQTIADSTLTIDQQKALVQLKHHIKKDRLHVLTRGSGENQQTVVLIGEKGFFANAAAKAGQKASSEFGNVQIQTKRYNYETPEEKAESIIDQKFGDYTLREIGSWFRSGFGLVPLFTKAFLNVSRRSKKPITREILIRAEKDSVDFTPTYIEAEYKKSAEEIAAQIGKSGQTFFLSLSAWVLATGIIPDIATGGIPYLGDVTTYGPFAYLGGTALLAKAMDTKSHWGPFMRGFRALLRNHKPEKDSLYIYANDNIIENIESALEHTVDSEQQDATNPPGSEIDPNLLVVIDANHIKLVVDGLKQSQGFSSLFIPSN